MDRSHHPLIVKTGKVIGAAAAAGDDAVRHATMAVQRIGRDDLAGEVDQAVFNIATARQHLITVDPQARFAISRFDEAVRLTELSRAKGSKLGQ